MCTRKVMCLLTPITAPLCPSPLPLRLLSLSFLLSTACLVFPVHVLERILRTLEAQKHTII